MRRFLLLLVFLGMAAVSVQTAVNAQGEPTEMGPIQLILPEGVQLTPDPFGVFFASNSDALAVLQSLIASPYQSLTGSRLSADAPASPDTPLIAGAILMLDAATTRQNAMIRDALDDTSNSVASHIVIDGRNGIYNLSENSADNLLQFGAVIDDPDTIVVILGIASIGDYDSAAFLSLLNSIQFVSDGAEPTPTHLPLLTFGFNTLPSAPDFHGLTLVNAAQLPSGLMLQGGVLSPDGTRLVSYRGNDGLCIYTTADLEAAPSCFPARTRILNTNIAWSPDSRYLAFHEDAFIFMTDSDLWVIDTQANRLLNYTDDGFEGRFFDISRLHDQGLTSVNLDYSPVWFGSTIYFFRTAYGGSDNAPTSLYRLDIEAGGTPEPVMSFSTNARDVGSIINLDGLTGFNGVLAVSPSGRWMAAVYRPLERANYAVLRFDLQAGTVETLVGITDLQAGMPTYLNEPMNPAGVAWLPDESGLLISTGGNPGRPAMGNVYQYEFASRAVTPLLDFSSAADETAMPTDLIPSLVQILPDRSALVWGNGVEGNGSLWSTPLPLSGTPFTADSRPTSVAAFEYIPRPFQGVGQTGDQVTLLVGGQLLSLRRE
ncbi:MAG: hypothetical protein U0670_16545 [Anaerolineae bacterium]